MTNGEIAMLAVGVALGAHGMNFLHAYWTSKAATQVAAASQAAWKNAAGDRFLGSLRLYQLQHRSRV